MAVFTAVEFRAPSLLLSLWLKEFKSGHGRKSPLPRYQLLLQVGLLFARRGSITFDQ